MESFGKMKSSMIQTVWMVVGRTEGWDEFAYTFSYPPTEEQVDAFLYKNGWKREYEEVGFTNWDLIRTEVITKYPSKEDIAEMKKAQEECE